MKRLAWHAYSGIVSEVLSEQVVTTTLGWNVVRLSDNEVLATFATQQEAIQYFISMNFSVSNYRIRQASVTTTTPALTKQVLVVPVQPLPIFSSPGKILTTRGYWDVVATTTPRGNVTNFAFGMVMLPVKSVFGAPVFDELTGVEQYTYQPPRGLPDPLLDDPGFFAYDSFVRVTTDVNQDPPFHSKTQKKFAANSALAVVCAVEVAVENLQSLRLDFGIRFRVLIES